ncbi:MAG: hypothetical protein COS65_33665 [Armatimonadetes bacterium CG06_land_8_20_14_3_00_66_21]|nr:MAG: hypothetical protein COS65_33665 [Armatimonadetes bacterium CG06_land_8_20_14_3_00_66_21]
MSVRGNAPTRIVAEFLFGKSDPMSNEDRESKLHEAEAVLAAVGAGVPLRDCRELADEFRRAVDLLEEAGCAERSECLKWDYAICLLHVRTAIAFDPSKDDDRFAPGYPDPDAFPPEAMQYYAGRALGTRSPVLKARYCDFLWERSCLPQKHRFAEQAIDAYLDSVRRFAASDNCLHAGPMVVSADAAATLALRLQKADKLAATVGTLRETVERLRQVDPVVEPCAKDRITGRWTLELCEILLHVQAHAQLGHVVDAATLGTVQTSCVDLAARFANAGNHDGERAFLGVAAEAAERRNATEETFELRVRQGESFEHEAEHKLTETGPAHLVAAAFYESAFEHYQRLLSDARLPTAYRPELQRRQDELKRRIREMYRKGRDEMGCIALPLEVPTEERDTMVSHFLDPETLAQCLARVASEGALLPNVASATELAERIFESGFLFARLPLGTIADDMAVSRSESDAERRQALVDRNLLVGIQITSALILPELFDRLRDEKGMNTAGLVEYFDGWGAADESNLEILRVGFDRYFAQDYVSALHVLVPQFEDMLRALFEKAGHPVTRLRRRVKGWEHETLGSFVEKKFVRECLPVELRQYVRLVMADPGSGWNLRNRAAHGTITPRECTKVVADTVIHLLLTLTAFRLDQELTVEREEVAS